jgi:hypothetical protein
VNRLDRTDLERRGEADVVESRSGEPTKDPLGALGGLGRGQEFPVEPVRFARIMAGVGGVVDDDQLGSSPARGGSRRPLTADMACARVR